MRRQRTRITLALLCAGLAGAVAAPGAGAHATFSGTVCDMLSPAQVTKLKAPAKCTSRALEGPTSTSSYGFWQPTAPGGARLAVTVVEWKNAKQFALAQKTLQALPGQVEQIKGIGTLAYESSLGNAMVVNFVVGQTIVNIQLQSTAKLSSAAPFNAVAKTIAAKI